jgi:hypothetical protein
VTLAPHVRLYVDQERQKGALEQEIADRQDSVAALEHELDLWGEDAFVAAQARERLHYVMPGETGYVVAPPEGGEAATVSAEEEAALAEGPWYRRVWAGFQAEETPSP